MPIDGGDAKQLTDFTAARAVVSPDGKQLACVHLDEEGKSPQWVVAIIPFEGGKPIKSLTFQCSGRA